MGSHSIFGNCLVLLLNFSAQEIWKIYAKARENCPNLSPHSGTWINKERKNKTHPIQYTQSSYDQKVPRHCMTASWIKTMQFISKMLFISVSLIKYAKWPPNGRFFFFFFPCMYIITDLIGGTGMEQKEYFSLNRCICHPEISYCTALIFIFYF